MSITCQTFTDWLSKAEEMPLSEAQQNDMQMHRADCPLCARFEQQQASFLQAIRALPEKGRWTLEDANQIQKRLMDHE